MEIVYLKKRSIFISLVLGFFAFFLFSGFANAQVPGDFSIPCQLCGKPNNDVLNCNNKTVAPFVDFSWSPSVGATKYEIYYKNTSIGSWGAPKATVTNLSSLKYAANVLLDSQNHYYIKAINGNTGEFKSCSINFPASAGGCKAGNTNYASSDEGAEANCQLPPPAPPTCTVSFSPSTISAGGFTTQNWSSTEDADGALEYTCNGNLGPGVLPVSGTRQVAPSTTQTCTFTARNTSGTTVTCSATITVNPLPPPPPPPGPPPPPPPVDNVPPVITNVRITNITTTTATVLWDTNELADSQVEYCTGFSMCGINTALDPQMVTSHTVNLSNLTPNTTYTVWVKSKDSAGNQGILGYFLFTTLALVQPPPPPPPGPPPPPPVPPPPPGPPPPVVISNVQLSNITYNSVTVSWNTDRPATSAAISCTNPLYCSGSYAIGVGLTTNHLLTITRLQADTQYYVWIISKDAAKVRGYYTTPSFRTLPGLGITNLSTSSTSSSVTVNWSTNFPANSLLVMCRFFYWCTGPVASDSSLVTSHSLTATGLLPGTRYYYYIVSKDASGYRVNTSYLLPNSVDTLP